MVGIVAAALVQNEFGVVCLPAPYVAPAVVGALLDFSLDLFLIFRSLLLYSKAYDNDKPTEFVVFLSSIALLAWHLVPHTLLLVNGRQPFRCHFELVMRQLELCHIVFYLALSFVLPWRTLINI